MAFSSAICYLIVTVTIVQVIARYVHVRIDLDCSLSLIHHSNCEFGSRLSKCRFLDDSLFSEGPGSDASSWPAGDRN